MTASGWTAFSSPDHERLCNMYAAENEECDKVGLFLLFASWDRTIRYEDRNNMTLPFFRKLLASPLRQESAAYEFGIVRVDRSEEEIDLFVTDPRLPCPPERLPCILVCLRRSTMKEPEYRYLTTFKAHEVQRCVRSNDAVEIPKHAQKELMDCLCDFGMLPSPPLPLPPLGTGAQHDRSNAAIRIFIAGDRMSVGKTSVCLGLLGTLVTTMGYAPQRLGYIKPATQNEKPQLVQRYCERMGIPCVSVGPIVYYRGFTRAYLAGETESSDEMLRKVGDAVDSLARDKDVVIVDGVGFPAVGSICGTDNASVAIASSYPESPSSGKDDNGTTIQHQPPRRKPMGVLVVGGPGVGGAVDAFNLNAAYFERVQVPVLGAIFNKLALDGFYSLENCKAAISSYFAQNEHQIKNNRQPFGFVPLFPKFGGSDDMKHVFDFIRLFAEHVDVGSLMEAAYAVQQRESTSDTLAFVTTAEPPVKRQKLEGGARRHLSREAIEQSAIQAGAAPSA